MKSLLLGPVPQDTSKAMSGVISKNGAYLQVGDQIENILAGGDLSEASLALGKPSAFITTLALVTLFQFGEAFTDQQAVEAARGRVEWKYALHLPLSHPGFDPVWLCRFREVARNSVSGAALLQTLAGGCQAAGLFQNLPFPSSIEILNSICRLNRIVHITEAMLIAVEALAARGPGGPQKLPLAHLYEKYALTLRSVRALRDPEGTTRLACRIGEEVSGLFCVVERAGAAGFTKLPEIIRLRKVFESQYELLETGRQNVPEISWRPADCPRCSLKDRESLDIWE